MQVGNELNQQDKNIFFSTLLNFNNLLKITEPPVGALRFRNPVAHRGWSGVRDASNHGNTCPSSGW